MTAALLNFEGQQIIFELEKEGGKTSYLIVGQNNSAEAENRVGFMTRVVAGKVRADMSEFIKVCNI